MRKVKFNIRETEKKNKSKNVLPFVMAYHQLLNSCNGVTRKNIYLLNMVPKYQEISSLQPMVFFSSTRKFFSYLI